MNGENSTASGEITYLSKSAFAASQNWSASYVTKLKDQNRLVMEPGGKRVNVEATLALLGRTSDPGKESVRQHHAAGRTDRHVGAHVRPDAPEDLPENGRGADPKYWDAKAQREQNLAELAALELGKKRGELVEREKVEAAAFASGRVLRDTLLGLPVQLAPELAALNDPAVVENKLREAIRKALADHARMTVDDLNKIMEPQ